MNSDFINLYVSGNGTFERLLQFEVLCLAVVVIVIFTFIFPNNYGFVIILLAFVLYVANMYIGIKSKTVSDFNKITMFKLNSIQSICNRHLQQHSPFITTMTTKQLKELQKRSVLDALYYDSDLIHFIYSIRVLADYNLPLFAQYVGGVNNILKLKKQTEDFFKENGEYPENLSEMLQVALQLRINTINNLHDFIYSVPKTSSITQYINQIVDRYNVLISRNMDVMYRYYSTNINQRGITSSTKFVDYNVTKAHDVQTDLKQFYY
jgi:hypothetical protein